VNLIERYALSCGVKIGEPYIFEKFFPLSIDKYITLHTTSKEAKNYDYFQEVVDILFPILDKEKIGIIQLGTPEDKPIFGAYRLCGQTDINQAAYVVKHGLLHMGVDSFPVHIAGHYNKPIVALYSTNWAANVCPYWGEKEKQTLFEPDRSKRKPSFSNVERPKTINEIKPEDIAEAVCKHLNLPFDYPYKTVYAGEGFGTANVECILNQVINPAQFNLSNIIVRLDLEFNQEPLPAQLSQSQCVLVTKQPIEPGILQTFKPNILEINYEITKHGSPDFIKFVRQLGIKYNLFSYLDEEELNKQKSYFMDFGVIFKQDVGRPKELDKIPTSELFYKSTKFTLSKGKIYPSYYAVLNDLPIEGIGNHVATIPNENHLNELWKESRHLRFFVKK